MRKTVLVVLDGFGVRKLKKWNAIANATLKNYNALKREGLYFELNASGKFVGLPSGNPGNSEVGHLHISSGRLVKQDLARINDEIRNRMFFRNKVLAQAMRKARATCLHLMGLISDGGVHSHLNHAIALFKMARTFGVEKLYFHVFTDGRDVPPKSALKYLERLEAAIKKYGKGKWRIATLVGRYYAMDRDNRWNRLRKAYRLITRGEGINAASPVSAIKNAYACGETDEFISPTFIDRKVEMHDRDVVIFFNFRSDRARQLTRAFCQKDFKQFNRGKCPKISFYCLTQYDSAVDAKVAYPPPVLKNTLGEVISGNGLRQYRLAETEKWAHVTYFFNGLSERIFPKEERLLIPSPKVSTYDRLPEMSAYKIASAAVKAVNSGKYHFILINFANADMVGHTGVYEKTVRAVSCLDICIGIISNACKRKKCTLLITADHGNAETMRYSDGTPCKSHTSSKVPLIIWPRNNHRVAKLKNSALYNLAPTVLKIMKIKIPAQMSEKLLIL